MKRFDIRNFILTRYERHPRAMKKLAQPEFHEALLDAGRTEPAEAAGYQQRQTSFARAEHFGGLADREREPAEQLLRRS